MGGQHIFVLVVSLSILINDVATTYDGEGGQYLAIISDGTVNDLGWTAVVNQGRVSLEQDIDIGGSVIVESVSGYDQGVATGERLVLEGKRVIIFANSVYGEAATYLAAKYPNVTFGQYGSYPSRNLPNLSGIMFEMLEYYYVAGIFCGSITRNGKIGLVYPGEEVGIPVNQVNAVFSGVMYANESNVLYMVTIDATEDADRETGAANILLGEHEVDCIISQTGDLVIPRLAVNEGILAVGTNGYSLRDVFGELVGLSIVFDWSAPLKPFAVGLSPDTVYKGDFEGTFANGFFKLDQTSHFVTAAEMTKVNYVISLIETRILQYLCGDYMAVFGPLNTLGCLSSAQQISSMVSPTIVDLGHYSVPTTDVPLKKQVVVGLLSVSVVMMVFVLYVATAAYALRNRKQMEITGKPFLVFGVVGTMFVYAGSIMWIVSPSDASCLLRIWLPSLGGTMVVGSWLMKVLVIYVAFFLSKQFKRTSKRAPFFIGCLCVVLACNCIILITYSVEVPKGVHVLQGTQGLGTYQTQHVCPVSETGNSIVYVLLGFHGGMMLFACYLIYCCRIIDVPKYDERKMIGLTVALVTAMFIMVVAMTKVDSGMTDRGLTVLVSIMLFVINTLCFIMVFGGRIIAALTGEPVDIPGECDKNGTGSLNVSMTTGESDESVDRSSHAGDSVSYETRTSAKKNDGNQNSPKTTSAASLVFDNNSRSPSRDGSAAFIPQELTNVVSTLHLSPTVASAASNDIEDIPPTLPHFNPSPAGRRLGLSMDPQLYLV